MRIRVLHMIENLEAGGAQRRFLTDLNLIDRDKFENRVCYLFNINELEPEIKGLNLNTCCLELKDLRDLGRGVMRLKKLLRDFRADIIHTQLFAADICGRLVRSLDRRIRVVNTVQSSVYASKDNFFRSPVRKFLDSLTARISGCDFIAVSEFAKQTTCKYLGVKEGKVRVIYNSIDIERFNQINHAQIERIKLELAIRPDEKILLSAGKLNSPKGFRYLIEAMDIADKKLSLPWRLFIAGDGGERHILEEQILKHGLQEKILFLGKIRYLRELLELCDVFILPTLSEGLPLVILEALAARKPCISTDIEPLREIINSGIHGLLAEPANSQALAEMIARVLKDTRLSHELAENGFRRIIEKFDALNAARQLEKFYEDIMSDVN